MTNLIRGGRGGRSVHTSQTQLRIPLPGTEPVGDDGSFVPITTMSELETETVRKCLGVNQVKMRPMTTGRIPVIVEAWTVFRE